MCPARTTTSAVKKVLGAMVGNWRLDGASNPTCRPTSAADWCDARLRRGNVLVNVGRRRAQRSVKSCAGVVRLASKWKAGLVSVAEAKQLSFFLADDYEVSPPSHADWLLAILGTRRPVCRCGDPYKSHQHYRKGADCSFCRCERYGPCCSSPVLAGS